jgi:hypothetical protein
VLRPQAAGETLDAHEPARKARVTAAKLCEMLPDLPGLTEARIGRTLAALEALLRDLDATLNAAAAKTSKASASANRTARAPRSRSARGRA